MNLTFSVILYPHRLPPDAQFDLSRAVALACMLEPDWQIKWPNDIYIHGRKAGGILIENMLQGGKISASIVGIGLNVNQIDFPPELPNATSMALERGQNFDLEAVLDRLLENLEHRYLQLRAGHVQGIRGEYHERLFRLDVPTDFRRQDGTLLTGAIRSVADDGHLLVETEKGLESFKVKEVQML